MDRASERLRRISNLILTITFPVAIFLPLIGNLLRLETTSDQEILSIELRLPAEQPSFDSSFKTIEGFPQKFDAYYNDNFGFRKLLISWHSHIKYFVFNTPSSKFVTIGKSGWLFWAEPNAIAYYRRTAPFTTAQLAQWKIALEERQKWLANRGIEYVFVVAPNKDTIYPEFVPDYLKPVQKDTRLDQLIKYLKENSDLRILDLRDDLISAKSNQQIYFLTDTHWNQMGAFVGYLGIMKHLRMKFPKLKPVSLADFELRSSIKPGGDLARFLGLSDRLQESTIEVVPSFPTLSKPAAVNFVLPNRPAALQPSATEISDPTLPSAVIFHDSFGDFLKPFLSEHFKRTVYVLRPDFDPKIIQKEHPDVVIHEMVERGFIDLLSPENPPEIRNFNLSKN